MPLFPQVSVAIDRGGTFTDVVALVRFEDGSLTTATCKLLSVDPEHYLDAPSEGIRRILAQFTPLSKDANYLIPTAHLEEIRMGTTVATNALLEHKGVPSVQVVTRGFADILAIGNQSRPEIFALNVVKPEPLPARVIEARERVRVVAANSDARCNGYQTTVLEPLDETDIQQKLQQCFDDGFRSVGVSLMHSYAFSSHETRVGEIARTIGFTNISLSSILSPSVKYVPRTTTSSVDAYLTPLISEYISSFRSHFVNHLEDVRLLFIQSDGGLTSADSFVGYRAVLSGPAGGVVGCAATATQQFGDDVAVLGFDMGGTSTDVSRCVGTNIEHVFEATIGGSLVQAPQVEVNTVAAGGGSVLKWEHMMFAVGPESAGAFPGPACYGRGGPLTITDANLLLGRINADYFPHIFGPRADEPLCAAASRAKFEHLTQRVNADRQGCPPMSVEEVALSFVVVADEAMCRPMRQLTEAKGRRADEHVLSVFGGAGGQHACGIAKTLGIRRVFIHNLSSYLSAVGISMTDVVEDRIQSFAYFFAEGSTTHNNDELQRIQSVVADLKDSAVAALQKKHGLSAASISVAWSLSVRFEGTNTAIITSCTHARNVDDILTEFTVNYKRQFGFLLANRRILLDDVWVRVTGSHRRQGQLTSEENLDAVFDVPLSTPPLYKSLGNVYFEGGWQSTPILALNEVGIYGKAFRGPALIVGNGSTVVVDPSSAAYITRDGNMVLQTSRSVVRVTTKLEPLPLSIFSHRFMSIAEQMGNTLQRTSISTNIKERLDFSCAVFDPVGNLVANAPHIPVHLGAMGAAIRWQRDHYGETWRDGDVLVSNHPQAGGSHLPDITVMTPCFHQGKVVFYVASRGHHADVGGTTPGSMPPFSRTLSEEGAAIMTLKLVEGGVFQEVAIRAALMQPASQEGMSGCRTLEDSISDLKAQVAANQRGVELVRQLVDDYGLEVVQAYMVHIQDAAEHASRSVLRSVAQKYGANLECEEFMDDGSAIRLKVSIDGSTGAAVFDFRDSSPQVMASTNCPTAVVHSAVIYCVRCMVGSDIPLNQGCLAPVQVLVAPGSILCPDADCAVVAGNVLTSQRITDAIFGALRAVACSQGCMNNFTFGNKNLAYYETICGGSGAGPGFNGASCVQTHMTNTRITDPEILELRYPVLLMQFEQRRGSGGRGKFVGGDGCIRSVLFLENLTATLLTERRTLAPRGLEGGGDGTRGVNLLHQCNNNTLTLQDAWRYAAASLWTASSAYHRVLSVGGKNTIGVRMGDILQISTPGGGGYESSE